MRPHKAAVGVRSRRGCLSVHSSFDRWRCSFQITNDAQAQATRRPAVAQYTHEPEHCRLWHSCARFFPHKNEHRCRRASAGREEIPMVGLTRALLLAAVSSSIIAGAAFADTNDKKIAFSNNYAGNSWRQAMLKSYDIVTKKAVADGVVA